MILSDECVSTKLGVTANLASSSLFTYGMIDIIRYDHFMPILKRILPDVGELTYKPLLVNWTRVFVAERVL